jgi:hypothetical protein
MVEHFCTVHNTAFFKKGNKEYRERIHDRVRQGQSDKADTDDSLLENVRKDLEVVKREERSFKAHYLCMSVT